MINDSGSIKNSSINNDGLLIRNQFETNQWFAIGFYIIVSFHELVVPPQFSYHRGGSIALLAQDNATGEIQPHAGVVIVAMIVTYMWGGLETTVMVG